MPWRPVFRNCWTAFPLINGGAYAAAQTWLEEQVAAGPPEDAQGYGLCRRPHRVVGICDLPLRGTSSIVWITASLWITRRMSSWRRNEPR